ncbi:hypothetical protein FJT64_020186 [Amphibalanus amphitrite]|uniref:Uncharacterized protein n=1 Tax=Amphibalanus amphitrite TaxID=1232801 RepID=A0A6A4WMR4_AMPAM|nr:hypothetical protein FJT64_020186 [Amphibalanus amphitrite]
MFGGRTEEVASTPRQERKKRAPRCLERRAEAASSLQERPGFVVKKALDSVSCSTCQEALVSDIQPDDMTQLYHLFIISAR